MKDLKISSRIFSSLLSLLDGYTDANMPALDYLSSNENKILCQREKRQALTGQRTRQRDVEPEQERRILIQAEGSHLVPHPWWHQVLLAFFPHLSVIWNTEEP
ncbi:hypothetical protein J6590_103377 [Homalodisca vitripennis]|nr:hypothetical protein J6590_103377 [Homalodisca vitripennis]